MSTISRILEIKNSILCEDGKARSGLPHITTMDHKQFKDLVDGDKVHLHSMTEKTDGQAHVFGHDEHGFYTQSSGSGSDKMRSPEDFKARAKAMAEKKGVEPNYHSAEAFGHIHKILASNKPLQDHLKAEHTKTGADVKVRGESFYKPWGRDGDHPGETKFVGTSYATHHMGTVGKYVIHTKLPENANHDVEHFKKNLSSKEINFDDDKIHHVPAHVDVKDEHKKFKSLNHDLLSARTTKTNKEAKTAELERFGDIKKRVAAKVDAHIKTLKLSPKWGSGSEGIVVHPSANKPTMPRFKVTSDSFRKYKADTKGQDFKSIVRPKTEGFRAMSFRDFIAEEQTKTHHVSVIPLVGFSPISHMGHAHDLGGAMKKLPEGDKHIGISSKADVFDGKERGDILHKQWGIHNLQHHVVKSAGETIAHAYHAAPKTGRRELHLLVGSDRADFAHGLKKSLEAGKIKEMGEHKWDAIHVHTPEDGDRSHGMSGTKMRTAVSEGNHTEFKRHLGPMFSDREARRIHNKIRDGLNSGAIKVKR